MKGSLDHPPIVVQSSNIFSLLQCLAGFAVGFYFLSTFPIDRNLTFYLLAIAAAFAWALASLFQVLRVQRLEVSPDGVTLFDGLVSTAYGWRDIEYFTVLPTMTGDALGITLTREAADQLEPFEGVPFADQTINLGSHWKMSIPALVDLLCDARERWEGQAALLRSERSAPVYTPIFGAPLRGH